MVSLYGFAGYKGRLSETVLREVTLNDESLNF